MSLYTLNPNDDQALIQTLRQQRANILQEVLTEQNARLAAGGITKTNYSLNGRSIPWMDWLKGMNDQAKDLTVQIQALESGWEIAVTGW